MICACERCGRSLETRVVAGQRVVEPCNNCLAPSQPCTVRQELQVEQTISAYQALILSTPGLQEYRPFRA